jgi:GNAT superfamily N-acetyltransferase
VVVRPARAGESDLVAELHAATATVAYAHIYRGQPFPMERTRERWRSFDGRVAIAEDSGRAVGFTAFDDDELHALYVLPAHWGRGIGNSLLAAAGSVSRLWVIEANVRARRFYERHGWRSDGAVRYAFGVPEVRYRSAEAPAAGVRQTPQ